MQQETNFASRVILKLPRGVRMNDQTASTASNSVYRVLEQNPDVWFRVAEIREMSGCDLSNQTLNRLLNDLVYRLKLVETTLGEDLKADHGIKSAHSQARYFKFRNRARNQTI